MLQRKSGHIINVVDVNGILATPSLGLMTTAVRALEGYSESLALSVFEQNVKVTIVESALEVSVGTNPLVLAGNGRSSGRDESVSTDNGNEKRNGLNNDGGQDKSMIESDIDNIGNSNSIQKASSAPDTSIEREAAKFYSRSTLCGETKSVFSRISIFPKEPFNDTIHAVMEVAGVKNPPGRIAAGLAPSSQIREYLSAMSDDLDDFDPDAKNAPE
ncbi:hypothetical protein AWJ20_4521 [Sugiyamaella lignohabitans]|uniref:Uncharacterized protein n=1 Tax=Sugiyamaella lignohabitans TaxID=796027 RepID=A0A167CHE6_9ASCO|nr:uncharacterized protein AWJ20_4521 [Sugiyamaella lignohabitans]ANB11700.1 hypothetical protein AWJ20_4521 [Sugiyamaella lignohabitans]